MNLVEMAKLPRTELVEWLKTLRRDAAREHSKLRTLHRANMSTLRMESFHEGRLHAIDQMLAQLHPGHLQNPERWTGELDKDDECDHWGAWACSKCKGFGQPVSHGACNCHWPTELNGIHIDTYDDSGGQAPIFDVRHPALKWTIHGDHFVWREVSTRRVRLTRLPATQADLFEGVRVYRRCFGNAPEYILLSYRGALCGMMLCGAQDHDEYVKKDAEPASSVDVPGLLHWRYTESGAHFTAEELAASLSVDGLPSPSIPDKWRPSVTAFRKLRQDARVRKAQRFLEGNL